jgi:hypothetical protein
MDIHKPKPWHGWREFLKEYAIIVVGVLTALGAEQIAERIHEAHTSAEARENIRAEIAANLADLAERSGIETCLTRRLDEVDRLIDTGVEGMPPSSPLWIGHPIMYPVRDSQYRAAAQAGRVSLLPTSEQSAYASIYAGLAQYGAAVSAEADAWADLRVLERRPKISPAMEWGLRHAVQQARQARFVMEISASGIERAVTDLAIPWSVRHGFTEHSACLPLATPRAEALKRVVEGRVSHKVYDEP